MKKGKDSRLESVIISRMSTGGWRVARVRNSTGESAVVESLEEAFSFVRAIYDELGELKEEGAPVEP